MATPVTWPSGKQVTGWAKETTQGTAVTPPAWTAPLDNFTPKDVPVWLADKAMRGSMAEQYGNIQGPIHSEFDMDGPAFFDGLGFLLNNILGDQTESGASAPFTHAFSLLNSGGGQPGSLTIVDYQGTPATSQARVYPGACLSELTIKGNAETSLVTFSAKGVAYPSSIYPSAPPVFPAITAAAPLAAWRTALGIGGPASGGTAVKTMREWSVTISRAVRVQHTAQNSQVPYIIQRGAVSVAGSLEFTKPADEQPFLYMINNTQPQVQLLVSNGGGGATLLSLQVDMQVCSFTKADISRSEEAVGYNNDFTALANTTNAGASAGSSPIKVTLQNAVALSTY